MARPDSGLRLFVICYSFKAWLLLMYFAFTAPRLETAYTQVLQDGKRDKKSDVLSMNTSQKDFKAPRRGFEPRT